MPNPLLSTDVYKVFHSLFYAPGTTEVYSYLEARKPGRHMIFFGLQYYLMQYLRAPSRLEVLEAVGYFREILGEVPDEIRFKLLALADLGYWPVEIHAVPEGTRLATQNVLLTIRNTHPDFYWCVGYLESLLLKLWNPCTVATASRQYYDLCLKYAEQTCDDLNHLPYQVHDFGYRGVSSEETAAISGAAHLLNFYGSDTIPAVDFLQKYYQAQGITKGLSVSATEHSVMCSYGRDNEFEAFDHILDLCPKGIVSIVSDTYDYWNILTNYLPSRRERIMSREGKTVIRPDCYDDQTEILTQDGWMLFKDLQEMNLVAQYTEAGEVEFVKPEAIIEQEYDGEMIELTNQFRNVDLLVTPNHRVVTRLRDSGDISILAASEYARTGRRKNVHGGLPKNGRQDLTWEERFLIAYQADGSMNSYVKARGKSTTGSVMITFNLTKQRKIDRLVNILENCGYEYTQDVYENRPERTSVRVKANGLPSKLFDWVNLAEVSGQWCQQFMEELSHWDSYIQKGHENLFEYCTRELFNAKTVQAVGALANYRTCLQVREDKRKEAFSDIYRVNVNTVGSSGAQLMRKRTIHYKGRVYCVRVPSGMLLVRRNGCVVVSGNSGIPNLIINGDHPGVSDTKAGGVAEIGSPAYKGSLELLWNVFGGSFNSKGFRVLDPHIGLIYGDAIHLDRFENILQTMKDHGFASSNLVVGVGGLLLQQHNRDELGFAIKATSIVRNGVRQEIYKDPATDPSKKSKRGLMSLRIDQHGNYFTQDQQYSLETPGELRLVFRDGFITRLDDLNLVRDRVGSLPAPNSAVLV